MHKHTPAFLALVLALGSPSIAHAEAGLPPEEAVRAALDAYPRVQAAQAGVGAARAESRALTVGPHEFTLSGVYVRRTVDQEGRFGEYDAQLSRPFRLPGKSSLDRKAGTAGIDAAQNHAEDARHQAALLLADLWWTWQANAAEAFIDEQAVANLDRALSSVRRRVQLREAPQLDADLAAAALGNARLQAAQSRGRAMGTHARLAAQFPNLPLPQQPDELPLPALPDRGLTALRDHVIARSHEVGAAAAEAERKRLLAQRAKRDRIADPTLGARIFSERAGEEKGFGIIASIPLGGRHRSALAERAGHESTAAAAELNAVRLDVQAIADADLAQAEAAWDAWQRSREGLEAQVAAVMKMRKGYGLGAIDLADLLLAERQTHEGFRSEMSARSDALRAITRLRIDSHTLWIGDDQER